MDAKQNNLSQGSTVYLGVDGGGTFLRALLISEDKEVISSVKGDTANIISVGEDAGLQNLKSIIERCIEEAGKSVRIERAVFALAGISTRKWAGKMTKLIQKAGIDNFVQGSYLVTNDTLAALWEGASLLPAVVVVSGTGSHCLGINRNMQVERSLGLEYILSDEGSSFYMGERVLRAITKNCDGRGPETLLKKLVFSQLAICNISDLFDYIYNLKSIKKEIAQFGRFATEAANMNDLVAIQITSDAVNCLVEAIATVTRKLNISEEKVEVITIGGTFENSSLYRNIFEASVKEQLPNAIVKNVNPNAALGAAKLALEKIDVDIWSCYE